MAQQHTAATRQSPQNGVGYSGYFDTAACPTP
jgi:hypothetical protein